MQTSVKKDSFASDAMCATLAAPKSEPVGVSARNRFSPTKLRRHSAIPNRSLPLLETPPSSPRASSTETRYDTKYHEEFLASVVRTKQTVVEVVDGKYEYELLPEEEERDVTPSNRAVYLAKPLYVFGKQRLSPKKEYQINAEERARRMRIIRHLNRSKFQTELFPLEEAPAPSASAAAMAVAVTAAMPISGFSSKRKDKDSKVIARSIFS